MRTGKGSWGLAAIGVVVLAGCAASAPDEDASSGESGVTEALAIPTYVDRAESVCPASHPKRKADQMGFANMHDQCCYGTITPYCTGGYDVGACNRGEAYVIVRGVDRCASPVQARRYVDRGKAKCATGAKLTVDAEAAASSLPLHGDTTWASRDTCCRGSTCEAPRCGAGELLAVLDGPDHCVSATDLGAFEIVARPECPAGTTRATDARERTMDVCCPGGIQGDHPNTCDPLVVIPSACPAGSKVVSLLGDDACVTSASAAPQ